MTMRFGLQLGGWSWPGGAAELAPRLGAIARTAEEVGFSSISVMDHFVQIPTVGREWEDIPESTTTLGFLAAATTHRPPRRARQRRDVPQPGPPGQDRRHARRAVGRAGVLRPRHGVVRARARAVRLGLPARRPPLRAARGRPRAAPADVGQGLAGVRRPHHHGAGGDVLPAPAAGARADPRRRLGRAAHAAPRRPLRRRLQPVRRARRGRPQGRRAPRALPRRSTATRRRSPSPRCRRRRSSVAHPAAPSATTPASAPSRSRSVATASTPRPASTRPSSPSTSTAPRPRSRPSRR